MPQVEIGGNILPRGDYHLVRFLDAAEQTAGGIWLPQTMQENFCEAEVVASGPGWSIPKNVGEGVEWPRCMRYATMWGKPEDTVIFRKHLFIPLSSGSKEGMIRDEDLLALTSNDSFFPLNDWVKIELEQWRDKSEGGILLPEECRHRPLRGKVVDWGAGKLIKKGELSGCRLPCAQLMGLQAGELRKGLIVHWSNGVEALEVGREYVEAVLVRAGDLDAIEVT